MKDAVIVRAASESDLAQVAEMLEANVAEFEHPAAQHPRPISRLRDAFFGERPVARLLVAERTGQLVGMCQWARVYDLFWAKFGGEMEWLFVRPEARGRGVPAALVAQVCREIRDAGGEFLKGAAEADDTRSLYERIAIGWPARTVYLSAEAFQVFADLAGREPRDIVRGLPDRSLNRAPARPR